MRRELEKLETRLKAKKVTVQKELVRLDRARGNQMDAMVSKVGNHDVKMQLDS